MKNVTDLKTSSPETAIIIFSVCSQGDDQPIIRCFKRAKRPGVTQTSNPDPLRLYINMSNADPLKLVGIAQTLCMRLTAARNERVPSDMSEVNLIFWFDQKILALYPRLYEQRHRISLMMKDATDVIKSVVGLSLSTTFPRSIAA